MRPFWHPLSALYIADLRVYATPDLIRMMLRGEESAALLYRGDRMGPPETGADPLRVEPCRIDSLEAGDLVVASVAGIPDLLRVVRHGADGRLDLQGDCDPGGRVTVEGQAILARACLPSRRVSQAQRVARRLRLDLREARRQASDGAADDDPASSVLRKYDTQASFYAAGAEQQVDEPLLARLRRRVPPPGRFLVIGSGSGGECFSLARAGYQVLGVDFAPRMVERARRGAQERGLEIEFLEADIRTHREEPRSLAGALFTYDVFSFLPDAAGREALLRELAGWLGPEGVLFLSARRVRGNYQRAILTLQWGLRPGRAWGNSHTRYLTPDGSLRRSFVHYFSSRRLRSEARAAGFLLNGWTGGHVELSLAPGRARVVARDGS